ncbi:DUF4256 domain-containing protein [Algoriphagus sp. H41]|uniref:DUF4256 domain-containing protein n=1 Tax=Algoriphagus oliviformis TaxID=2811231 RepID=A0ABS3C7L5_9BACT|nr:DUF4256 domain-containing protein [Algoriphagus oliviformis]MBN7812146.1 DUF4256 domain-containing protein [Algoriphagus oliviformis]
MSGGKKELSKEELLAILALRFEKNKKRHPDLQWALVLQKLEAQPDKIDILHEMETTGGEPDVVALQTGEADELCFVDCAAESPSGRRSCCYDLEALESRKEHKPANAAVEWAEQIGSELLTEEQYRQLQQFGKFDAKTSSWVRTPESIRKLGGAIFCDWRYGQVFTYHNGASSYYAARGFRTLLRL